MTEHNVFYYPYASFTNAQLPLLEVAALYFDELVILDPVGASRAAIGADYRVQEAVNLLKDAGRPIRKSSCRRRLREECRHPPKRPKLEQEPRRSVRS